MKVAVTGATGFLGRYILHELARRGDTQRAWFRPSSDRSGLDGLAVTWVPGSLNRPETMKPLVEDCDAVIHAALDRPGAGFRGAEGDLVAFVEANVMGTLRLIEASRAGGVPRFIFISTCAVHEVILDDRPLDEAHPTWATSHYGAHKAAIESFVTSYGLGQSYPICALRPTGIYGLAHPPHASKWYRLVSDVAAGRTVKCTRGGKEVHAADVARAVAILLDAPAQAIAGQAFNCYDRYISEYDVAQLARELSDSNVRIEGQAMRPKHQIETGKLQALGMRFGGEALLRETIAEMLNGVRVS